MSVPTESAGNIVINIDLRRLGDNGTYPWKTSFRNVEEFGSSFAGNGHARLWSIGGACHLHIANVSGYHFDFDVTLTEHAQDARFYWTLRRSDGSLHRGEIAPDANRHLKFSTPISDHSGEAVFALGQVRETAAADKLWTVRNIRITAAR